MRHLTTLDFATLAAAVGCGLNAGVFFAFSVVVMKALGTLPAPAAVAAMQAINVIVINPWFMTVFLGTGLVCLVLAAAAFTTAAGPHTAYWLAGAALYVLGVFVETLVFNVPRNEALARLAADSAEAARYWTDYLSTWTAWNHVRTVAALAAAVAFTLAFGRRD